MGKFKGKRKIVPSRELEPAALSHSASQHKPISISFRYIKPGKDHCLSKCNAGEVRAAIDCLRQVTTLSWLEVRQTGGKNKVGLGFTEYKDYQKPIELSQDLVVSGIRASQCGRVFGAYKDHIYYVIRFDPKHKAYPE